MRCNKCRRESLNGAKLGNDWIEIKVTINHWHDQGKDYHENETWNELEVITRHLCLDCAVEISGPLQALWDAVYCRKGGE